MVDYLLKPYTSERFLQAVDRVQPTIGQADPQELKPFIFIKTEHRLVKLMLSDIIYIEGMRDYRKIHTADKKIMTLKTFSEFELEIPPAIICRIHKSYMVNVSKISSIEKGRVSVNDIVLPVSETYKKVLIEQAKNGKGRLECILYI